MVGRSNELRVVHARKSMLYARRHPGRFMPLILAMGIGLWLWAVIGATGALAWPWVVLLASAGLGLIGLAPLLPDGGSLMIDLDRGWVHWRTRGWGKAERESFSPSRIEGLRILRHGLNRAGFGIWTVQLAMDHPRLTCVSLGWTLRRAKAHRIARTWAAALEAGWTDELGLLHLAIPGKRDEDIWPGLSYWQEGASPPPEIKLELARNGMRLVLPNLAGISLGLGPFLIYGLLWCLWAWSILIIELRAFGPMAEWGVGEQWTIALLVGGSVVGLLMLVRAVCLVMGEQVLERRGQRWLLTLRWLGIPFERRQLKWKNTGWIRRVDPPGEETGLWLPNSRRDIRLAPGHSAEALAWLHELLVRAK